jgi:aldehyde dehydrogenase (NAD+)
MTSVADRPTGTQAAVFTAEQASALVAGLRSVHASGKTQPLEWRLRQLKGMVALFEENEPAMAEALAADLGRNAHDTWFGDVASTVGEARYAIKHLKKWMRPKRVGVPLAVIGPWNYPFYLCFGPMVGALAAGNCVVLKPSEHAPAASALMAQLIPKYLDKDAVRVVEGEAGVTQELIDARVDHIFFTGGTEIGRKVMQAAAKHLTPVTLELGGKSPVIVTKNADLEVAARRILWGKIVNSGQTCLAPDYILVENSVKAELVGQLKDQLVKLREGESKEQQIVNERQFDRLSSYLDEQPGQVVAGGGTSGTKIETTLVVDADPASAVMSGEIFGPILPILGVKDLSEAITFVNAREKPLASYLFSKNKGEQQRVLKEISCGGTVVNHTLMHVLVPQLPFGGVGESGMGAYHGKWGFECFSHRKSTLVMPTKPDLKMIYPPYSDLDKKLLRKLA